MPDTSLSCRAWTLFEPIHAIVYFAPEARPTYKAAGLRGGWMGYFASRSAAMGAVNAEVVTAVFHNFQPAMVARAIPTRGDIPPPSACSTLASLSPTRRCAVCGAPRSTRTP